MEAYKKDKTSLSYEDLAKQLAILKKDGKHLWLNKVTI